ncbi:hypothetical protein TWF106_007457 [Orbilia oligospora]|uniref:Uncharacterized protein n=1 Tax=Orbilia oligospora TaxID=2813651 RepID=A0A7C8R1F1_ORBOL|nr:hypothetical protein TWF106_007457 [Orbilia oligospora]
MCKSIYTFQCHHTSVAEPQTGLHQTPGECRCGRFDGRKMVTFLCPGCMLFNRAIVNPPQLSWLLEQQENTAEIILTGSFSDNNKKITSGTVEQKTGKSTGPFPVSEPVEQKFRPTTYAAAVRGKPGTQKSSYLKSTIVEDQQMQQKNFRQQHGGRYAGKRG